MPEAREAALAVLDHWLARGVDGFRLDVANAYLHDPALTNNPPVPMDKRTSANWAHAPNLQYHFHDSNLPRNLEVLDEIRRTVEQFSDRFVMGEFSEEPERCGAFAASDKGLHSGYSFPLLHAHMLGPEFIRGAFRDAGQTSATLAVGRVLQSRYHADAHAVRRQTCPACARPS